MRIRLRDNVQTAIEMAMIDPLTGLNNRRYLESHLATLLDQAAHRGRPLSLMILDIDHFKAVNDTRGHNAGDEILKSFSSASARPRARPIWSAGSAARNSCRHAGHVACRRDADRRAHPQRD
jgi:predicted signal transduction protein with EAL and GGDEF domain